MIDGFDDEMIFSWKFDYLVIAVNGGLSYLFYAYASSAASCWAGPYSGAIASPT